MKSDLIDIEVFFHHETDKAILVSSQTTDYTDRVWLPKSVVDIEDGARLNSFCTITLPERLAIEKGLV